MSNNRTIEIERNPNGAGVLAHVVIDGAKAMTTPFPTLTAAVQHYERLSARRYMQLYWTPTDNFTATGRY